MFSFFTRNKKKVDVNSNDLTGSNNSPQQQASTSVFTPFFQVTTSVVPKASEYQRRSSPPVQEKQEQKDDATYIHPAAADECEPNCASGGRGIGNAAVMKTCKNKTFRATAVDASLNETSNAQGCGTPTSSAARHAPPSPAATMSSNVKPAGHGTIAISPRIPTPTASRRNSAVTPTQTPPESPRIVEVYDDCNGFPSFPKNSTPEAPPRNVRLRIYPAASEAAETEESRKKNLVNQETKFQSQLNDLSKQLAVRDAEANKLRFQMEELQRDVFAKSAGMDRLQAELQAAHKESEQVKHRLKNLECDLQDYRTKNGHLTEEIAKKAEHYTETQSESHGKISELEAVIRQLRQKIDALEAQIQQLEADKKALIAQHASILQQRDEDKQKIERQLEETIKQKNQIAAKWQTEFEKLRTVSLLKEQTLLDDFEWKLREVHKSCKTRMDEKEKSLEQRLKEAYRDAEVKMTVAQEMMSEVQHLKECKAEVQTLKEHEDEQRKAMQTLAEQQEELRRTEASLREEAKKLRSYIDLEKENLQHMQRVHRQELLDKERWLQNTLQEKKTEISEYWEERLLHEIGRLKWELEQLYLEEKQAAIDDVRSKKEDEFMEAKKSWEKKITECQKELKDLKKTLEEKETYYQNELVAQQTNSDREIFEFRRIMDKIDNAHHERFEKLSMDHDLEIEKLTAQHKDKLAEMEMSCKNQTSTLRASLILLKDQMEREAQQQINELIAQHRSQLDTQWANLVHQKSEAIKLLEQDYVTKIRTLEEQFYTQQKSHEAREIELLKTIDSLKNEIASKDSTIEDMQSNVDTLEGGVQVLNGEIAQQSEQLMKNRRDADQKIRGLQDVLMKLQALADQEREGTQTKFTQQQKQSQQQIDHLQKKVLTLTKLFDEVRSRYERRESRQEDLNLIADLRQVIAEQEKDLACINEEKRYYQMQMMNLQRETDESFEDGEDEFVDTDELPMQNGYTVTFPGESEPKVLVQPPQPRPKLSCGTINLAIPPTIPECDDCDDE